MLTAGKAPSIRQIFPAHLRPSSLCFHQGVTYGKAIYDSQDDELGGRKKKQQHGIEPNGGLLRINSKIRKGLNSEIADTT